MSPADDRAHTDAPTNGQHAESHDVPPPQKSTPDLARDILNDLGRLVQKEGELARTEIEKGVGTMRTAVGSMLVAAGFLIAGLTLALIAVSGWIATAFELGTGTASIIAAILGIGIGAALMAKAQSDMDPKKAAPTRTASHVRKDTETVRSKTQ